MIPKDLKKKVELNKSSVKPINKTQNSVDEKFIHPESSGTKPVENLILEEPVPVLPDKDNRVENISSPEVLNDSEVIKKKSKEKDDEPRQVLDRKKIETKIAELPDGIRGVLEEKFQADFVSIEKIDMEKLI
jgi:hypothetical protein